MIELFDNSLGLGQRYFAEQDEGQVISYKYTSTQVKCCVDKRHSSRRRLTTFENFGVPLFSLLVILLLRSVYLFYFYTRSPSRCWGK